MRGSELGIELTRTELCRIELPRRRRRLLLGLGLRSFSMHPSQVLAVKQEILRADTGKLQAWAQAVLDSDEPAELLVG